MSPSVVRFGDFEIDLRMRELRKGSATIRLQDQPFQILSMMLERPGDIVTREDIRLRLWPDGTSVDFEHSVNAAIKRLRAALGDDADRPRYVETLPRRGYRFIAPLDALDAAIAAPGAVDRRPRLVVLPFMNLSGEQARDYFSDGLTEEMIAQLGRQCADRIGVLARTSAMLYKNANRGAADIGEALRADYLVEGSVRVEGDRVRITAQLIETKGETHLWADSYDRRLADCLAVQMEVASEIAQALTHEILPPLPPSCCTRNERAYEAYLTGRFHWNKPGDQGLLDALARFDEAIALDATFARAHSARARVYLSMADHYRMDPTDALRLARAAAEQALALDSTDAESWVAIGEARRVLDWDWSGALAAYRKGLALNPNSEVAHRYYVWFLGLRQPAEALAAADRAYDLDPLCLSMLTYVAAVRYFAQDFGTSLMRCCQALAMEPSFEPAMRLAAAVLVQLGRHDEAVHQFEAAPERALSPVSMAWKAHALAAGGHRDRARDMLRKIERPGKTHVASDYHRSLVHVGLGDHDAAFALLARAFEHRDPWLEAMNVEPRFDPLRGDPRFDALRSRLRLDIPQLV
jgi:TolB-like protein/Tfp pilus assembly protein PilF